MIYARTNKFLSLEEAAENRLEVIVEGLNSISSLDYRAKNCVLKAPVTNEGAVISLFKSSAMSQLNSVVIAQVYGQLGLKDLRLGLPESGFETFESAASDMFGRLQTLKSKIGDSTSDAWVAEFTRLCRKELGELEPLWGDSWQKLCDGKQLFTDFQKTFQLRISLASFKRRIMSSMSRVPGTENWRAIEGLLRSLIQ